jgi:large subunit ribosomal protein L22
MVPVRSTASIEISPLRSIVRPAGADYGATSTLGPLPSQTDAENFAAFTHANRHQKVKPFIIKRRRQKLRTYEGNERNIRHSPWRMNLVCQFAAGLTVPEALKQLMFCQKVKAPLVAKIIRRTANLADIRHGLQPGQLEVAECFATHGVHLKRLILWGGDAPERNVVDTPTSGWY